MLKNVTFKRKTVLKCGCCVEPDSAQDLSMKQTENNLPEIHHGLILSFERNNNSEVKAINNIPSIQMMCFHCFGGDYVVCAFH